MFAIPLAWLQLKRERIRLLVALAGIGFAVILMFIQLGFRDALFDSAISMHENLEGDIFLISPQSTALIAMKSFSQRRLYQALSYEGVESISPIYMDFALWKNPIDRRTRSIMIIGFNPSEKVFSSAIVSDMSPTQIPDTVLFDTASREEFGPIPDLFKTGKPVTTEVRSRRVTVGGLFKLGASFGADGNLITSDLNFFRIFSRKPGLIDVGLIRLAPGADANQVYLDLLQGLQRLDLKPGDITDLNDCAGLRKKELARNPTEPKGDVIVLSKQCFIDFEQEYWKSSTAIGFIFGLGTAIGFVVGTVIVYQILYTDVADHLAEYATLKAMGYRNGYLLSVVFQEALILAALGYIPGFLLAVILYNLTRNATALPIAMNLERAMLVFCLAVIMCVISGAIAVRKVQDADPADIF